MNWEHQYKNILRKITNHGEFINDRTGVGCKYLPGGVSLTADLRAFQVPFIQAKKLAVKTMLTELSWMLDGGSNVAFLQEHKCHIWDAWADENGDLGPVYGAQWRDYGGEGYDQIQELLQGLRTNPQSRRHILSAWNPNQTKLMALPPCHMMAQWTVNMQGDLDCIMTQRSADMFVGFPFDIASYGVLTHLLAHMTGLRARSLTVNIGHAHIYSNHQQQVALYLGISIPNNQVSTIEFHDIPGDLHGLTADNFTVHGYIPGPTIKAPVAI